MGSQQVGISGFTSFQRKPESSHFKVFWMPDQVRHDGTAALKDSSFLTNQKRA
jgi:hypothetical protein